MKTYILEELNELHERQHPSSAAPETEPTEWTISNQHSAADGVGQTAAVKAMTGVSELQATELAHEIEFLTARSRSVGITRANSALAPLGLKVRSYSVLALACSEQAPSQRELAEFLMLDPSQIVALVDELQDRRLVSRETNPRDRRAKGICATVSGKRLYGEAREIVRAAESESLAPLDDDERRQLRSLLRRIAFADQAG